MITRIILISLLLTTTVFAADDTLADKLDKSLKIQPAKQNKFYDTPLKGGNYVLPQVKSIHYKDNLAEKTLAGKTFEIPTANLDYDYSDSKYAIVKIRPISQIRTNKDAAADGDIVKFKVVEDVIYEGKLILTKDSEISAVVENVSPNGKMGVPAHLVISRFSSPILEEKTLDCTINRQGQNRSLWVYPLSYVLMPFMGAGFPITFIRGGNVNIKPDEVIQIYYRPTRFRKSL